MKSPRDTRRRDRGLLNAPAAAGVLILAGHMVAMRPGGACAMPSGVAGERVIGVAEVTVDNGRGADGAVTALVQGGQSFLMKNGAGADALDPAVDFSRPCYAIASDTVGRADAPGARPLAGIVTGFANGAASVWVEIEPHAPAAAAATQERSDWDEADPSSAAFIENKPAVEDGAQANPRHVAAWSSLDSDPLGLTSGGIAFERQDGTQWQADNSLFDVVESILIAPGQAAYGTDVSDPDLPDRDIGAYVAHRSLLDDLADRGGESLWRFKRNADAPDAPGEFFWVRSGRAERAGSAWRLRGLVFIGTDFEDSAGEPWDISGGFSVSVIAAQIVDRATELVLRDGSNITDALRTAIQGINESARLKQKYTLKAGAIAAGEWSDYGSGQGGINLLARAEDVAEVDETLHITTWLDFGPWRVRPVGNLTRSVQVGIVTYSFDYAVISGAKPALDSAEWVTLEGADIHRGEVARQIFRAISPNIGGKGGRAPMVWGAGSADDDAGWVQSPALPLVLALSPSISRTFGPMSGNVLGEAYLTEDTGAGQFGTTKLLAVDKDSDAAVSAVAAGAYVHVEDAAGAWRIVKVLGARDAPELATVRQWYYEPWASSESDFSNAGAGTITMISAAAAAA